MPGFFKPPAHPLDVLFVFRTNVILSLTFRVAHWYVGEIVDVANDIDQDRHARRNQQAYSGGPLFHEYV